MLEEKKYSRLIQKCILTIENEYMYMAGVEEIAAALGVSKGHLIREFSKQVQISPNKYIVKYKLEQSKALLAEDTLSIDAIAMAVGFSCGNYYSKVFKKEYGVTPSEFKKDLPVTNINFKNHRIYL